MTIRFFILQAHYRSTVDFSNEALQSSQKGLERLLDGIDNLSRIQASDTTDEATKKIVGELRQKCYDAMNDGLNTQIVISYLFDACRTINTLVDKKATITAEDLQELTDTVNLFAFDLLGLKRSHQSAASGQDSNEGREEAFGKAIDMLLELRAQAKANKDWATSDKIRDDLAAFGFEVKDTKDGATWKLNK